MKLVIASTSYQEPKTTFPEWELVNFGKTTPFQNVSSRMKLVIWHAKPEGASCSWHQSLVSV
ncbi:hypothetical protein GCM10007894_10040 [Paraferrimonas haliotis]|uniref:Uncharacterized protein n=1 Tax=Paraferrimonas haliotis TaxID=2013866 RepID=A0AA37WW67_9GAMM|nr:hypothetical protein GCM10007894_10040 [Paraferrimonas haliotis]